MKDEHIIAMLESAPFSQLSEGERETARAHAARCAECGRAYEAAQVSSRLLKERVSTVAEFEPPPFFQTRVLAALRERRAAEEAPALTRLWRAAGALASSMALTVAALALLTFTAPGVSTTTDTTAVATDISADEAVLLAQDDGADEEVDYDQVFSTIYETGDAGGVDGQSR